MNAPLKGVHRGGSPTAMVELGIVLLRGAYHLLRLWRSEKVSRSEQGPDEVPRVLRERKEMITQTDVNAAFKIGESRTYDVCAQIDDDELGVSEIAGMMMAAMTTFAMRRDKTLLETAIEVAENIKEVCEREDDE